MARAPVPLLSLALALAACNAGFEPQYLVKDLRILAVRSQVQGSQAADGSPGDTMVLEALVANPLGRAGLTVTWYGCPPVANESLPPCADPAYLEHPERFASAPPDRVVPLGTTPSPAPDVSFVSTVTYAIPATDDVLAALQFIIDTAVEQPAYQCRVFAELTVVAIAQAEGRRDLAVKRVRIVPTAAQVAAAGDADAYVLNLDPAVLAVLRAPTDRNRCTGGTAIGVPPFPAGETVVCGLATDTSIQLFNVCGPDGVDRQDEPESLSWQWYATAGEFPEIGGIGNATGRDVDFTRPSGPFTLWAILRDGRGGEAWLRSDVE